MLIRTLASIFFITAFLFTSCTKESIQSNKGVKIILPNPGKTITASVQGRVVDMAENAIEDVEVTLGDKTVNTDEFGFFVIRDVRTTERASLVTVFKSGYFKGYRNTNMENEALVNLEFKLIKREIAASFNSGQGMNINHNGNIIDFSSNIIEDEFGQDYTGNVDLYVHYYDPTADDFMSTVPGGLDAIDEDGNEKTLESYAMLAVELEDEMGNALNIKSGNHVPISFVIPNSLINTAPDEIPLWYMDKELGVWIEEGTAVKNGNVYEGNVEHFSFWNCDYPSDVLDLKILIVEKETGLPLSDFNITLIIEPSGSRSTGSGITGSDGIVRGKVPKGKEFHIVITYKDCGIVYENEIGPYTNSSEFETVEVNLDLLKDYQINVSGKLVGCNGDIIQNGNVIFIVDGRTVNTVVSYEDKGFETILYNCHDVDEISAIAFDSDEDTFSDMYTFSIQKDISLGNLIVCSDLTDKLIVRLDNTFLTSINTKGESVKKQFGFSTTLLFTKFIPINKCWEDFGEDEFLEITFNSNSLEPGSYSLSVLDFKSSYSKPLVTAGSHNQREIIKILKYGEVGEYIVGFVIPEHLVIVDGCTLAIGSGDRNTLGIWFSALREK